MNKVEYEALKTAAEERLAVAKAEYERDLDAIERVKNLSGFGHEKPEAEWVVPTLTRDVKPPLNTKTISQKLLAVIETLDDEFTTTDLIEAVSDDVDRTNISSTLKRLADGDYGFELVEVGSGRRPNKFRKVESQAENKVLDPFFSESPEKLTQS